jgi:PadR family transcriptional regulator AphA
VELTVTSYALLGQLALRPWSVYEMTKNVGRTLHWFWPRAESVLYAEVKRLVARGLVVGRTEPGARGRDRAVYSLTAAGQAALAQWMAAAPSSGFSLHAEPLLRVHLAPYGTVDDLVRALTAARDQAEGLLRQAAGIAVEFLEGRHQFQHQVHVRALLFDYLWNYGLTTFLWAERSLDQVASWDGMEWTDTRAQAGLAVIAGNLTRSPFGLEA